jgi:uncharacterized protein YfdQ (DUF2303 family)
MDTVKTETEISAAVKAGMMAADADERVTIVNPAEEDGIPVAVIPREFTALVLKEALELADARAVAPRRRQGTVTVHEVDSFIDVVNRFKDADSVVFADSEKVHLTAILDYHRAGGADEGAPRWGQHRVVYLCPLSRAWREWGEFADKAMSQDAFGNFIDEHLDDLASGEDFPAPAAVLDMARHLVISQRSAFERKVNVTTGETTLIAKDEHDEVSSTKIPRAFLLKLQVFEGGAYYRVEARLRLSWQDGRPRFGIVLHRIEDVKRDAFAEVRKTVAEKTGLPVFAGVAE